jgi:hypothetical protein
MITKSPVQKLRPWMYAVLLKVEHQFSRLGRLDGIPKTKLASARFKNDLVLAICSSQLPCNLLRTVRAVVIDDDHLPGKVTTYFPQTTHQWPPFRAVSGHDARFVEHLGEEPYNDREVFALFISWEDDGVLVGVWGMILALHGQRGVALERVHAV